MTEEQQPITSSEVNPEDLEKLITPLGQDLFPGGEIGETLSKASLLGAVVRLGIGVESTDEYTIELRLPGQDQTPESLVSIAGTMSDVTPQYAANFFDQGITAPSPLAVRIFGEASTNIFTSDSENPRDAILGVEIFQSDFRFLATLHKNKMSVVKISQFRSLDRDQGINKKLSARYRQGVLKSLLLSQVITVEDPITERSRRVFENSARFKSIASLGAPPLIMVSEERMARKSLAELMTALDAEFEGEEITELIRQIPSISKEEILRQIFERAGKEQMLPVILQLVKEDTNVSKKYGLSVAYDYSNDRLSMVGINNFGRTTYLLERWDRIAKELKGEGCELWLHWLGEIEEGLYRDFDNYAAIVSGKIQFSEDDSDLSSDL